MVIYHNCGGERMASYIDSVTGNLFGDLPKQDALDVEYREMDYRERAYDQIHFTGLSGDHVHREAKRAMDGGDAVRELKIA
jgi:hypothetical protein